MKNTARYAVLVWDSAESCWVNAITHAPNKPEFHKEHDAASYALELIQNCPKFIYLDIAIEGPCYDWCPIGHIDGDMECGYEYVEDF